LPDDEKHFPPIIESGPQFAGAGTYQLNKLQAAFPWIKNFGHAVDVGAHCGLWSRVLARCFKYLTAFEPLERHRECFVRNVPYHDGCNVFLSSLALGDCNADVRLTSAPDTSGSTAIADDGEHLAGMNTLDFMIQGRPPVDFIKVDTDGFDEKVLRGGKEVIRRDRPCLIIEQKRGRPEKHGLAATGAIELLQSWGAVLRQSIKGDHVLSWD
jgi:FkbM family methyltransferase